MPESENRRTRLSSISPTIIGSGEVARFRIARLTGLPRKRNWESLETGVTFTLP